MSLQLWTIIGAGCGVHPSYRAKRPSRATGPNGGHCVRCDSMWDARKRLSKWAEIPPLDRQFLELAEQVAEWSKDPRKKCGAVIVRPDLSVCSVGFNRFPKGVADTPTLWNNQTEKRKRVVHAEEVALLACREPLQGYTLYSVPGHIGPSCDRCAASIIEAGIMRVVHPYIDRSSSSWADSINCGLEMFAEAGVIITSYHV